MSRYGDLHEGDEIPSLELKPGLGMAIRYCAIGWVFPPIFFDVEAAHAQGMPGMMVPGPLKLGFLYRAVEEWLGDGGFVRHVRAAHRRPDLQGRTITVTGRVARLYEEEGSHRADIELAVVNDEGQQSVRGFASVQFFD